MLNFLKRVYPVFLLAASSMAWSAPATPAYVELGPFSATHSDAEMISPKSVLYHPSLDKMYINALEAGKTLVYSRTTLKKIATISHSFKDAQGSAPGKAVIGKPVEGWFTHNGKYLWVTYYRWSTDPQAMHGSGFALIDTSTDKIVKVMPTGNIPKFITADEASATLAVTLWGANQVEVYDIKDPLEPKLKGSIQVGPKVTAAAGSDRDSTCGLCLRGTAFIPNSPYAAVAQMGGGGLAIVDTTTLKVVRKVMAVPLTPRHLQVFDILPSLKS